MGNIGQILLEQGTLWVPRVGIAIFIFLSFWILAKLANRAITRITERLELNAHLTSLFVSTTKVTLVILGVITALGTLGINISALVAGLGLTGFALGFALKDTISNLLAGVLILLYRPFVIGDRLITSGYEGTVVSIDLRYTQLEGDGNRILIPNSKLFTDPITVLR